MIYGCYEEVAHKQLIAHVKIQQLHSNISFTLNFTLCATAKQAELYDLKLLQDLRCNMALSRSQWKDVHYNQ